MESALCFACASNNKESSEFFLFVLKLDAEKELKRLRGEASTDLEQNSQTTTTRQQRPGILRYALLLCLTICPVFSSELVILRYFIKKKDTMQTTFYYYAYSSWLEFTFLFKFRF